MFVLITAMIFIFIILLSVLIWYYYRKLLLCNLFEVASFSSSFSFWNVWFLLTQHCVFSANRIQHVVVAIIHDYKNESFVSCDFSIEGENRRLQTVWPFIYKDMVA